MSRGNDGGSNAVVQGALSFLVAGLNALAGVQLKESDNLKDDNSFGAISQKTENWVTANFTQKFGYIFQNQSTIPTNYTPGGKLVSFDDMLVWDKAKFTTTADVQNWIQAQLTGSIPIDVVPPLANNLTSLINTTFELVDNSWEGQSKSYNIPFNISGTQKNMSVDVLMISSCATSSDGSDTIGICRLTAVAYETGGWKN